MFGGDDAVPARAAQQGRDGHRLRLAALDGPGRRLRHRARLAHRRPVHAVRLRRPDEHRAALRGPGASCSSTSTSTPPPATGPVDDLDYCLPVGKAAVRRTGVDVTVISYLAMTQLRARGRGAGRRRRRRGHRPALAGPGQHRLGHHRRQHPEDQQRADRRAGRRRHVLRRLAGRRDPAPLLRLARPARRAGHRRRGVAEHQQGAGAGRHRPGPRRSSPPSTADREEPDDGPSCCACRGRGRRDRGGPAGWPVAENTAFAAADVIATVETDKAVVDVEAEADGVMLRLLVRRGHEVEVGDADRRCSATPDETVDDLDAAARRARRRRAAATAADAEGDPASRPSPAVTPAPGRRPVALRACDAAATAARRAGSSPARSPAGWRRDAGLPVDRPAPAPARAAGSCAATSRRRSPSGSRTRGRPARREPAPPGRPRRRGARRPARAGAAAALHRRAAQPDAPGDRRRGSPRASTTARTSTSRGAPGSTRCSQLRAELNERRRRAGLGQRPGRQGGGAGARAGAAR